MYFLYILQNLNFHSVGSIGNLAILTKGVKANWRLQILEFHASKFSSANIRFKTINLLLKYVLLAGIENRFVTANSEINAF